MWKLFHRIFGFHYVSFEYGWSQEVRRIRSTPNGKLYVKCYGDMLFLDDKRERFNPLTWTPAEKTEP